MSRPGVAVVIGMRGRCRSSPLEDGCTVPRDWRAGSSGRRRPRGHRLGHRLRRGLGNGVAPGLVSEGVACSGVRHVGSIWRRRSGRPGGRTPSGANTCRPRGPRRRCRRDRRPCRRSRCRRRCRRRRRHGLPHLLPNLLILRRPIQSRLIRGCRSRLIRS